jgi:hypothetical protein
MSGKIFINYRREDAGYTGRLVDRLQNVFEPREIFLDVDNIAPGLDFVRELNDRVAECDIMLAVIGQSWIDARDSAGARRLDNPDDFVRIELVSALSQDKLVVPVLVGGAVMPRPDELPDALKQLARRHAVRLTHERFRPDVEGLIKSIQEVLKDISERRQAEAEAEQARAARQHQESEAARRVEQEAQKREAERKAVARAAAERERQATEIRNRTEQETAFASAKRQNTITALDSFLSAYPQSYLADECRMLKATLVARGAYAEAIAAKDTAKPDASPEISSPSRQAIGVRARLVLRNVRRSRMTVPAIALALLLALGFGVYFLRSVLWQINESIGLSHIPSPSEHGAGDTAISGGAAPNCVETILCGTVWVEDASGVVLEFLPNYELKITHPYKAISFLSTYSLTGASVEFWSYNDPFTFRGARYQGTVEDHRMSGIAYETGSDSKWTWVATKKI